MPGLTTEAFNRLGRWVERRMAFDATPGLSLAVTDRERVVHAAAFGSADLAAGTTMSPDHLLEIGSIGKSFTAIALLRLADEGRVDLQAPVTEYLPWFSIRSEYEPITLHHLLTHTAGIPAGCDFAPAGTIQVWAARDMVAATPPGERFHYSNLGYKVLGEVLRAVTGEGYGPTIRDRILRPLGLTDAAPTITNDIRHRLAVGYVPLHDDRPWFPGRPLAPATWLETDTGDGCLAMTATDLATYLRMLLNRGEYPRGRILTDAGFAALTQRAVAMEEGEEEASWYGYGVVTEERGGRTWIGHPGGMVGYLAVIQGDPGAGLGVAVLMNGPGAPFTVARTTLEYAAAILAGLHFELPEIPAIEPPPEQADEIAGDYAALSGGDGPPSLRLSGAGGRLTAAWPGGSARVVDYYGNLVIDDPAMDRFVLRVERDGGGRVVGLSYGDTTYAREGETAPEVAETPAERAAYTGLYRSFSPWNPSLRVVLRGGRLWLVFAGAPDGFEDEQPLAPLENGSFRAGDDPDIPERVRFAVEIEGRTHVAHVSGCDFYRVAET